MITYEKACEIAAGQMPNIDACVEYDNAYMFQRRAENHSIGGHGYIVILKDSGKALSRTEYLEKYAAEQIREFDLSTPVRSGKGGKSGKPSSK